MKNGPQRGPLIHPQQLRCLLLAAGRGVGGKLAGDFLKAAFHGCQRLLAAFHHLLDGSVSVVDAGF